MFDFNPFIRMVRFVLWLDQDRDENPVFLLINPGCMDLLSVDDCIHDPSWLDGCIHVVDPCIHDCKHDPF